jgi:dihydrofolate reductase
VDELRLSVHPVLVGSGQMLFRDGQKQPLEFVGAKTFGTGVVVLTYRPAGQPG